jgi:hypothetical protein
MTLREWLDLPHRFRWGGMGGDDCLMFCASWVERVTGIDPVEDFRGTYSTAEEAEEIVSRYGGMTSLVDAVLTPIGLRRTDEPQTGDIGVVVARVGLGGEMKEVGAIRFGPLWACLSPVGVVGKRLQHVAAWRVGR